MTRDLRENERDLSKFRAPKLTRHLVVVKFNLSGNARVGRSLERECTETTLGLEERKGGISTLEEI